MEKVTKEKKHPRVVKYLNKHKWKGKDISTA